MKSPNTIKNMKPVQCSNQCYSWITTDKVEYGYFNLFTSVKQIVIVSITHEIFHEMISGQRISRNDRTLLVLSQETEDDLLMILGNSDYMNISVNQLMSVSSVQVMYHVAVVVVFYIQVNFYRLYSTWFRVFTFLSFNLYAFVCREGETETAWAEIAQ